MLDELLKFRSHMYHIRGVDGKRATPDLFKDWTRVEPPAAAPKWAIVSDPSTWKADPDDLKKRVEMCSWCETNCLFNWVCTPDNAIWFFEDEDDAASFKLRWC